MIGKTVTYSGYSASYTGNWRLFYADTNNAYLITNDTIDSTTIFGGTRTIPLSTKTPTTVMESGTYGGTWNSAWLTTQGVSTSDSRHKAVIYLCDPDNWSSFVATNAPTGTYAVGGPTAELYVASWNLRVEGTGTPTPVEIVSNYNGYSQSMLTGGIKPQTKAPDGSE